MNLVANLVVYRPLNGNQVKLTWTASTTAGVTSYNIYKSACDYGPFTLVTTLPVSTTEYYDTVSIIPINTWFYWIVESNGTDTGPSPTFGRTYIDDTTWTKTPFTQTTAPNLYPSNIDMSFFFAEIRRRNQWMLEQDGEWFKLLKHRYEGTKCPLIDTEDGSEQCPQPLGDPACYGTGFVGGYYSPAYDLKIRRAPTNNVIRLGNQGFALDQKPRFWTLQSPIINTSDIIVDQMDRRYVVLDVTPSSVRGQELHQEFTAELLIPTDIRCRVPVTSSQNNLIVYNGEVVEFEGEEIIYSE